jgi:hypothetical protein
LGSEGFASEFGVGFDGFVRHFQILGDRLQGFSQFSSCQDGCPSCSNVAGAIAAGAFSLGDELVG